MTSAVPTMEAPPPPWYRQFWPWFLIAIPLVSVLLGVLMITLATHGHDALVVDDWYKEGKAINRRIERDREASRLGLSARFERVPGALLLDLDVTSSAFEPPPALAVRWVHATRAERDGGASFVHAGGNRYVAAASLPVEGRWRLHVEPDAAASSVDALGGKKEDATVDADTSTGDHAWRLASDTLALTADGVVRLDARSATTDRKTPFATTPETGASATRP